MDLPIPVPEGDGAPPEKSAVLRWKFCFTSSVLALLTLGLLLCAAGVALTTWQFIEFVRGGDLSSALEWIK